MPFDHSYGRTSQTVRIPLRVIEAVYGAGNDDNAGDDVIYCLRCASDYPDQYRMDIALDDTHDNPWYHAWVFTVQDISEPHFLRFEKLLREHNLL